ncbi:hypothetical protein [Paracoccus tegillarcae]|nr:hypothetical protein [Paracoccus tegillarcae]
MSEVHRVAPDLLREMWIPPHEMRQAMWSEGIFDRNFAAFRADGPIMGAYMQAFAAKIGFALHYEATGNFVPRRAECRCDGSQARRCMAVVCPQPIRQYWDARIMQQGKITSQGNFEYGWGTYLESPDVPLYYARVREAFAAAAFVVLDEGSLPFPEGELATFAPGDLVMPLSDRITAG